MRQFALRLAVACILAPVDLLCRWAGIVVLGRKGTAIGDQVVMTGAIRFFRQELGLRAVVFTTYPELFRHNPDVLRVYRFPPAHSIRVRVLSALFRYSRKDRVIRYQAPLSSAKLSEAHDGLHLRELHLAHTPFFEGIRSRPFANRIVITRDEAESCRRRFDFCSAPYALIQSQSKRTVTTVKDWGADKMEAVARATADLDWVQVGVQSDPRLAGVRHDLRGQTTLRELAFLFRDARVVLCCEGFYTHLSGAYGTPCVTVASGYCPPGIYEYPNGISVERDPRLPCAYCWSSACPLFDEPRCVKEVPVDRVVAAVRKITSAAPGRPPGHSRVSLTVPGRTIG